MRYLVSLLNLINPKSIKTRLTLSTIAVVAIAQTVCVNYNSGVGAVSPVLGATMASVKDHGAVGDGVTDDTIAIQNTLNTSHNVFFPEPATCYKITGALHLSSNQTVTGNYSYVKGICSYSTTADGLFASFGTNGARNIVIRGMFIADFVRGTRTSGHAIHIDGSTDAAQIHISDTQIYGFEDGLNVTSTLSSNIDNVRVSSALHDSFHWQLISTSTNFNGDYADAPGRYGYYADILNYSTFSGTACDNAGSDCYHLETGDGGNSRGVTFNSPGVETTGGHGMYLDGENITVNSPMISGVSTTTSDGIYINGAAIVTLNGPRIQGGIYGVYVARTTLHTTSPYFNSVVVWNPQYTGQGTGTFLDANNQTSTLVGGALTLPGSITALSLASGVATNSFSATPVFNLANGDQLITLTGNVTSSTLSNITKGQAVRFKICQDATGSRTFVWPTAVKGGGTIGSTLSTCNVQTFESFDGTNLYATGSIVINQ